MRPILFRVPGLDLNVHGYGVFIFAACAAALLTAAARARREKVDPNAVYELATWLFLGGIIGARLFYFLQQPEAFHRFADLFRTWEGGNVFYGCILGGVAGSSLYWLRRPFPFARMADTVAPGVAVGAAVGRIGCFLNGCCFGRPCAWPWGMRFPAGSHAWARQVDDGLVSSTSAWSLPVHPTQLYSIVASLFVLAVVLLYANWDRRRAPGRAMAVLMIVFSVARWPIESLRDDESPVFAGLTWAQLISAGLIVAGLAIWFVRRAPLDEVTPLAEEPRPEPFPPTSRRRAPG